LAEAGKERRVYPRKDVSLRVRVKAENLDDFVEQYAHNISKGGLFLRSQNPYPVDTMLQFEIQLKDGSSVLRGRGKVTWSQSPPGPGEKKRNCGMGVKFVGLDADSKALVLRILDHKEERNAPLAARDEPEPSPAPSLAENSAEIPTVVDEPALAGPETTAPEPARPEPVPVSQRSTPPAPFWRRVPLHIWLLLGGATLGALVVTLFLFLSLPKNSDPVEEPPELNAAAASAVAAPVEKTPEVAAPPEIPEAETVDPPPEESGDATEEAEIVPRPIPKKRPSNRRYGYLSLNTDPWVEVYLGPRKLGVTPLVRVKLRAGKHRLKLVNWEDGINSPLVIRINPGKTTKLVKRFSP
jgi:uncharacterized protein (TIGR02266 family)